MANSTTVTAGTKILASQYNNLRADVLDASTGHKHDGTDGRKLDWDEVWSDAVHDHSADAEGGQLDWDTCWADAVHDHTSDAEGGIMATYGRIYQHATSAPGPNNDGVDSAGIGRAFREGDIWVKQDTDDAYICADNATGAATWVHVNSLNLDDLGDVQISSPSADEVLTYDGTKWVNGSSAGGMEYGRSWLGF